MMKMCTNFVLGISSALIAIPKIVLIAVATILVVLVFAVFLGDSD